MLVTRDTLLPATRAPSLSRISPVGRSMVRAGALGEEGERKMYESEATWTLISRKGRAIVEQVATETDSRNAHAMSRTAAPRSLVEWN